MKYAYEMALKIEGVELSIRVDRDRKWGLVWSGCVAFKVKVFWLRVLHEIIPVMANLRTC